MTMYQDVLQAIRDDEDSATVEAMIADERAALTDEQMADLRRELSLRALRALAVVHGEKEGRQDYFGRARDVAAGEPASWAWPWVDADDAYLNATTARQRCKEIGIPEESWDDVSEAWLDAFRRGYEAAHAEDE